MTVRHAQTSPQPDTGRHGGVFRFRGVPPRDHGPGGGGRLTRLVTHILDSNVHGSLRAPVSVAPTDSGGTP